MAEKNKYVHINHNGQEIQNVSHENLTTAAIAALAGGDLFEGRIVHNSTTGHMNIYAGAAWHEVANVSDLNKFGALSGVVDVSGGLATDIPDGVTAGQIGSGVDELGVPLATQASLQKGDFWIVSVAGSIPGIQGDDNLDVGDLVMCTVDGSITPADWIGIQMNINDSATSLWPAVKTAALVAVTPLSFAAEMAATTPTAMTTIASVQVIDDATGEDITSGLRVDWTAKEVESNIAIASVTITVVGN